MTHPFTSDEGCGQGRTVPRPSFGVPGTLYRTVFLYDSREVDEACNFATTYGVHDSLVHAIVAEN